MKTLMKPVLVSTAIAVSLFGSYQVNAQTNTNEITQALQQPTVVGSPAIISEQKKIIRRNTETAIYIVQLSDPSVASYKGGVAGLLATSPSISGERRLNVNSDASKNYRAFIQNKQQQLISHCEKTFGHELKIARQYQHVLNGFAIELSTEEAKQLAAMSDVISVQKEQMEMPLTDVGPKWIGADKIYAGNPMMGVPGSMGENAVVAILDTGVNHDHPSFADVGGDGYDHTNPLGSGNYIPGSYCDSNPSFCNDKLIGAWDMLNDPFGDPTSPEDSNGHGSHTASTTAGNILASATLVAPTTQFSRKIGGVAPHANIIMYDVCSDGCPGSALIAALEQVIIDASVLPNGIQALNYSISGGNNPYNDAVELSFLNVTAAGVYVAASAGNSGPGASTTGHNSPWVSATAAMTHNRQIVNSVTDLTSDGASLSNIEGAGFTSGYGPATIINSADLEGSFPGSTLCGQGIIGDLNPPWPPGTFNGEIIACTRGTYGRVEKGANALAAGAGGFILMDNGSGIVADPHVLPGIHITQADGAALANWLAANPNPMGTIAGFSLDLQDSNGDIMAGFSSRGPNSAIDIVKPDIGAPGVSIFAALNTDGVTPAPEYGFLSGTSMSSPHNAGSGALISMVTNWNPYEIKSALMMTAENSNNLKEDGVTPADRFDVGAGRINLKRVLRSGLVLDETPANFANADPALGGDPKTLNIASMQNSNCVGNCSWTRTVTNKSDSYSKWSFVGKSGTSDLAISVSPSEVGLNPGESATITINADSSLADSNWNFGGIKLKPSNPKFVELRMPVVVQAATSTSSTLSKTVDLAAATKGDVLTYQIQVTNDQMTDTIDLTDMLPMGTQYVPGSASGTISNGTEVSPLSVSGNQLNWSFGLDVGDLNVTTDSSPFGYFSLASLGVAPFGCPTNCDDGSFILNVPAFDFNGQTYTQVIWSVNGTLEVGSASGVATSFFNQQLPSASAPNNLMAPFWTDFNLGDGGNWYVAVLNAGPAQYTVYEWENVPLYGDPTAYTFQIWIENGTSNAWYVYQDIPAVPFFTTVGVENEDGTIGDSYYYNGTGVEPAVGVDLSIATVIGGTATANFQARITNCGSKARVVNEATLTSGATNQRAIAATSCSNP